ncbi:MAG: hypothetical protein ACYCXZ_03935 [Coriobacteriia bacterium]
MDTAHNRDGIPDVAVKDRLVHPHSVVADLRDDKRRLDFMPSTRARALRILQALAVAAEREGWRVESAKAARTRHGHPWDARDHLVLSTDEARVGLRLFQESDRTEHVATKAELAEQARWSWTQIPQWDYTPTDRLRLELDGWSRHGRQYRWGDRRRWTLDSQLGKVIAEVRVRDVEAREQRLEEERRRAELEERRRAALAEAAVLLRENHRAETLRSQTGAWIESRNLLAYVSAMRASVEDFPADSRREALEWLEWAEDFALRLDPLKGPIRMPDDPEPTPEALRPYLSAGLRY